MSGKLLSARCEINSFQSHERFLKGSKSHVKMRHLDCGYARFMRIFQENDACQQMLLDFNLQCQQGEKNTPVGQHPNGVHVCA